MDSTAMDHSKVFEILEDLTEAGGRIQDVAFDKHGVLFTREQSGPNCGQWKRHGVVDVEKARVWVRDYFLVA
ncbi:hypothetical protein [Sorangium sp. So ce341]|uniref:hypothetical protein n=1 Tax=Sorangium sp. So ce341 TaxID=3133302 RepID=UPI003F644C7A